MTAKKNDTAEAVEATESGDVATTPKPTQKKTTSKSSVMEVVVLKCVQVAPSSEPLKPGKQSLEKSIAESLIEDGLAVEPEAE